MRKTEEMARVEILKRLDIAVGEDAQSNIEDALLYIDGTIYLHESGVGAVNDQVNVLLATAITLAKYNSAEEFCICAQPSGSSVLIPAREGTVVADQAREISDFLRSHSSSRFLVSVISTNGSESQPKVDAESGLYVDFIDGGATHQEAQKIVLGIFDGLSTISIKSSSNALSIEYSDGYYSQGYVSWFYECLRYILFQVSSSSAGMAMEAIRLHTDKQIDFLLEKLGRSQLEPRVCGLVTESIWKLKDTKRDAVVFGDKKLSYQELYNASRLVAQNICSLTGPTRTEQKNVIVLQEPGLWSPVVMLGVFLAKCIYIPLPLDIPSERLNVILKDCPPSLIVTEIESEGLGVGIDQFDNVPVTKCEQLCLLPPDAGEIFLPAVKNEDTAYVIYTSGSTGIPKGVPIRHGELSRHIAGCIQTIAEASKLGMSGILASSLAFDVSIWEALYILSQGGTLHVLPSWTTKDPRSLAQYLSQMSIETACLRPATMSTVADEFERSGIAFPLKEIYSGAEAVTYEVCERFRQLNQDIKIIVGYGATETTIGGTLGFFDKDKNYGYLPIGSPIPGYRIYVVNEDGSLCAPGMIGNIWVGGNALSQGYINRPDETTDRFIVDPFDASGRVYKTGDQGKWLSDGNLIFCGRVDHQVKINGVRVELAEVETVFRNATRSSNALAMLLGEGSSKNLVLYLENPQENLQSAYKVAAKKLSKPMIPAAIVIVDRFPLTSNMKVDRGQLPLPGRENYMTYADLVLPSSAIEIRIAKMLQELIGVSNVGIDDDIQAMGLSSLMLVSLADSINTEFSLASPLSELALNIKTIRSICNWVEKKMVRA